MSEDREAENPVLSWLRSVGAQIVDTYRKGASIAWLAPPIFALVVLTEFAQHVYEIRIGLHEAERVMPTGETLATFWRFAYLKIAGLVIGMLLAFRFWMQEASFRRTLRIRLADLGRIGIGLLVFALLDYATRSGHVAFEALGMSPAAAANADIVWDSLLIVPQVLFLLWFLAALGSADGMALGRSARAGVRSVARLVILLPAAFVPAAIVHQLLHIVARGADPAALWTLMIADSFVVGLIGTLTGSALYVYYRQAADASAEPRA